MERRRGGGGCSGCGLDREWMDVAMNHSLLPCLLFLSSSLSLTQLLLHSTFARVRPQDFLSLSLSPSRHLQVDIEKHLSEEVITKCKPVYVCI